MNSSSAKEIQKPTYGNRRVIALVLLLAVAILFGARVLEDYADNHREAMVLLTQLDSYANQHKVLELEEHQPGSNHEAIEEEIEALYGKMDAVFQRLDQVVVKHGYMDSFLGIRDDSALDQVREGFSKYKEVEEHKEVSKSHEEVEATEEAAFKAFRLSTQTAINIYSVIAERASQIATYSNALAVLLVGLLAAWLSAHLSRSRRANELAVLEQRALRETNTLVQHASDIIARINHQGEVAYVSPAIEATLGHSPQAVIGRPFLWLLEAGQERALDELIEKLKDNSNVVSGEFVLKHRDGSSRILEVYASNYLHDPEVRSIIFNGRDITQRKALEVQLTHQALHDSLTGLPNRTLLMDRLEHALQRSHRSQKPLSVLFLDLDRFKWVNDSLGHNHGDQLLVEVARRIRECVRLGDTVVRLGGDEFTVLLEELDDPKEPATIAARIIEALQAPFMLSGQQVFVSTSIGIALGNGLDSSPETLLKEADIAMYQAKRNGGARFVAFDSQMASKIGEQLQTVSELKMALERGELEVYYQPKVELSNAGIMGVEALVRWNHPQRGLIPPMQFIPVAEETGLIVPIGRYVMETACRQAVGWEQAYGRTLKVSVNLSLAQLRHPQFVEEVQQILKATGLNPVQLELEVTESLVAENLELTVEILGQLRQLGITLAIDDFGTGASNMGTLKHFPVSVLKIDRSFVKSFSEGDMAIVKAVVALGRAMGMQVVAEGVETANQASELHKIGCHIGQGYYFARPMPAKELERFLSEAATPSS